MSINSRLRLLAVLVPFLLVVVIGIRDVGTALWQQSNLDEAAFEGLQWARNHRYDPGEITNAAQSAAGFSGISVAPQNPCGCDTNGALVLARCGSICPDGGQPQPYFFVTTSACYETALPWPGVSYCSANNSQCAAAGCTPRQILLGSQSVALQ